MSDLKTLCFLLRSIPRAEVLLGYKKTRFGAGKYAGFGGGVEAGETIEAAARRELQEEAGIAVTLDQLEKVAQVTFLFPNKPNWNQEVHVYLVQSWQGDPAESEEMRPEWFALDTLPYPAMWPDAPHWLPLVLTGQCLTARFVYAVDNATIAEFSVKLLDSD